MDKLNDREPPPPKCLRCGHTHTTAHGCSYQTGPASAEGTAPCCGCTSYEPNLSGVPSTAPDAGPWQSDGDDNGQFWILKPPDNFCWGGPFTEVEAIAVRDALNRVARAARGAGT